MERGDSRCHTASCLQAVRRSEIEATMVHLALPDWLVSRQEYEPVRGREGFIRRNLEHFAETLARIQQGGRQKNHNIVAAVLGNVRPSMRVVGLLTLVISVNLTRNMLYSYVILSVFLSLLALMPVRPMISIIKPAMSVVLLCVVLDFPGLFLGQQAIMLRMAVRAFVTVGLTVELTVSLPWNDLLMGLVELHVPRLVIHVIALTIQFVEMLGRSLVELLEALRVRSVGHDASKMTSAGNLLGVVFLRAHRHAFEMADAMACRGFTGTYRFLGGRTYRVLPQVLFVGLVLMCVGLAVYLG